MKRTTRRGLLLGTTGAIAASAAGGFAITREVPKSALIRSVLERYVGPLNMAEEDLRSFVAAFSERRGWMIPSGKLAAGYDMALAAGMTGPARRVLPESKARFLEEFERRLLGDFFTYTTVGFRQSPDDAVRFTGLNACQNPFAVLST